MNASDILDEIVGNLKAELGSGFGKIRKFTQDQGMMLAKQAELIAHSRIDGNLASDDEFFEWLLEGLKKDTANMVKSIAVLTVLTLEKAWNAVANALWGGIRTILGAAGLPAPLIPAKPPKI